MSDFFLYDRHFLTKNSLVFSYSESKIMQTGTLKNVELELEKEQDEEGERGKQERELGNQ
jgi:hypothetical protein